VSPGRTCDQRGAPYGFRGCPCGQRGSPAKLGVSTRLEGTFNPS
jgi:hypothetical protein